MVVMKNIIYILISFLLLSNLGIGQSNLVLNPGFEENKYSANGSMELRKEGFLTDYWYNPIRKRSPHLFTVPQRAVAKANSGSVAIGMILGGSKQSKTKYEYITGKLETPLAKGETYCLSFNILLHRSSRWAATDIGVLLHHDEFLIADVGEPQTLEATLYANDGYVVTQTKWQEFNGYFVASGGEQYISLGKFGEGESFELKELGLKPYFKLDGFQGKAYYQLDDFSVVAQSENLDCGCAEAPVSRTDTLITNGLQPYLFALDASGSMRKQGVFDSLRNNLAELLEQLPYGTPVTFSTFSSKANLLFSGRINQNTSKEVDDLLAAVELGSGTNVYSGLESAANSWPSTGKDSARIILISDGAFAVTNRIEYIVKDQFENNGRKLTVVQVESKARGTEKLDPYLTSFIYITPAELRSVIFQMHEVKSLGAIACECPRDFSEIMNYHFVIDYSGSMALYKNKAIKVVNSLYEKVPRNAVVSITAFSQSATELYVGKKSELSLSQLDALLTGYKVGGGTDPTPGVKHGVGIADRMAEDRFSHLILVTDLKASILNQKKGMKANIKSSFDKIDIAVSTVSVDLESTMDFTVSGRMQFDATTSMFRNVSKAKFENDLFQTDRSACNYTTQVYHYNPASDVVKKEAKKVLKLLIHELMKGGF